MNVTTTKWEKRLENSTAASLFSSFYPTLDTLKYETHNEGLRICHLNIRSLKSNFTEFCLSNYSQFDIISFSETNVTLAEEEAGIFQYEIPGYTSFSKARQTSHKKSGGGVCIFVRSNIHATEILSLRRLNIESIWVKLKVQNNKHLTVGCVYRAPDTNDDIFLDEISKALISKHCSSNSIILGDFNINTLSNSLSQSKNLFCNLMKDHNYSQIISNPTRVTFSSETLIDHIYVSQNISTTHTKVVYSELSDHFLICSILKIKPVVRQKILIKTRPIKKLNHDDFFRMASYIPFYSVENMSTLDDKVYYLTNELKKLMDNACPEKTVRVRANRKPWINKDLIALSNTKNAMFRKALDISDSYKWEDYRKLRNVINSTFRTAKSMYYKNVCSNIPKNSNDIYKLFKTLQPKPNKSSVPSICIEGKEFNENTKIANEFSKFFSEIGKNINEELSKDAKAPDMNIPYSQRVDSQTPAFQLQEVTNEDIRNIITSLSDNKSPGPDGIPSSIIKLLEPLLTPVLTNIVNHSITEGIFPSDWKQSLVVPIFKSGDQTSLSNYRPISLTNILSRILEKIVNKQIKQYMNNHNLISDNQHGFRNNHSCENLLIDLHNYWYSVLDNVKGDRFIVATSLDVKKAFDSVNHSILLDKLKNQFHFDEKALNWTKSFLSNRSIATKVNGTLSTNMEIFTGLPQGTLTGPTYFNAYTNDMNDLESTSLTKEFADDALKSAVGVSPMAALDVMNKDLVPVSNWYKSNLLMINAAKTNSLILSTSKIDTESLTKVKINDEDTSFVPSMKYLGIILDSQLSFSHHIDQMNAKIMHKLTIFQQIRPCLDVQSSRKFYISYIRPLLEYCPTLLCSINKSQANTIEKLQNRAIRIITQNFSYCSISALRRDLNIPTLESRRHVFILTKTHDIINGKIPSLHFTKLESQRNNTRNLRSNNLNNLKIPKFNKVKFGQRSFNYLAPKFWNNLPTETKLIQSRRKFISEIKNIIYEF